MSKNAQNKVFKELFTKRIWKLSALPLIFSFLFDVQNLSAQTNEHKYKNSTREPGSISESPSQADVASFSFATTPKGQKHTPTPKEVKQQVVKDYLETGNLPEGCHLYFGAVVCAGPTGGIPPEIYGNVSTRHSRGGTAASFLDSATGRENTRVSEAQLKEAYNKWASEDPQRAKEWMKQVPFYVEDRINYLNGVKITTKGELKEVYANMQKENPEAAEEWLNKRPHLKKDLK
jgi:hypothetical protein